MDFEILEGKCSFCLREGMMVHMFEEGASFYDQGDALISACESCLENMLGNLGDVIPPMESWEE